MGLPRRATYSSRGVLRRSPDAILYAGTSRSLEVLGQPELQRLAMLAICGPKSVLAVVVPVERRAGEQLAIVPLLKLHGRGACLFGRVEQPHALLDVALVIVPDLRDHVAVVIIGHPDAVDDELTRRARTDVAHSLLLAGFGKG
jgi:hypothetical protein